MSTRWRLEQLLSKMERQMVAGPGRGNKGAKTISGTGKSFTAYIKSINLDRRTAQEDHRHGYASHVGVAAPSAALASA
jgi:hypothetical protein